MATQQLTQQLADSAQQLLSSLKRSDEHERRQALDRFQELQVPHKKTEDYKYSNLSTMLPTHLARQQAAPPTLVASDLPTNFVLYFNNGMFDESCSHLPEGLEVRPDSLLAKHKSELTDPLEALNCAVATNTTLEVPSNQKLPLVAIVHQYDHPGLNNGRLSINVGELSEVSFVEVFRDHEQINRQDKCFINAVTHFNLAKGAHALHQKVVSGGLFNYLIGKVKADLHRDAHFNSQTMSVGASFVRSNIEVNIWGEGAHATVNGLYATRGEQHHDNFSLINHHVGHTTSHQIFKGILDDHSRGAFTGKIMIHPDAQLVDSQQLNKNLLLDKKARVDTRPQLEVYADDVKCAHGATVGQMSEEELFYLESRGIEKSEAQKVLCHAFAGEVLLSCEHPQLTAWLNTILFEQFERYALDKLDHEHRGENS